MKISNVEQRLVGIKKIGPERMLDFLKAKEISNKEFTEISYARLNKLFPDIAKNFKYEYTLYEVNLNGSKEKLLKMRNPSEDKWHYEWVIPEANTVNEALAWRRGIDNFKEPVVST